VSIGARRAILGAIICLTLVSCASGDARGPAASFVASASPSVPATGATAQVQPRTIELELTSSLEITQDGTPVTDIPVSPGETIHFVLTNTAGFDHDFYIGTQAELAAGKVDALPGVPTWSSDGPMTFDWVVPAEIAGLEFGCTLRGHYPTMHGAFSQAPGS
jgi:hypothetical protein